MCHIEYEKTRKAETWNPIRRALVFTLKKHRIWIYANDAHIRTKYALFRDEPLEWGYTTTAYKSQSRDQNSNGVYEWQSSNVNTIVYSRLPESRFNTILYTTTYM